MLMESSEQPEELATELEQEADKLERQQRELGADVDTVRQDWHRKRAENIPGTPPGPADTEGPPEPATEPPSGDDEDRDSSDSSNSSHGAGGSDDPEDSDG
jgi:hypothetical protein